MANEFPDHDDSEPAPRPRLWFPKINPVIRPNRPARRQPLPNNPLAERSGGAPSAPPPPYLTRPAILKSLEVAGLAGPQAPPSWREAIGEGTPTIKKLSGNGGQADLAFLKPHAGTGKRIGLLTGPDGKVRSAAILTKWPEPQPHDFIHQRFQANGQFLCDQSRLRIDLSGFEVVKVEESMHWEPCEQSTAPWWPFYVIHIKLPGGERKRIYMDMDDMVYEDLTKSEMGGG